MDTEAVRLRSAMLDLGNEIDSLRREVRVLDRAVVVAGGLHFVWLAALVVALLAWLVVRNG